MMDMEQDEAKKNPQATDPEGVEEVTNLQEEQTERVDDASKSDNVADDFEALKTKFDELSNSHLRLMAEFDNYRKRTLKEKADLIKNGGESALTAILPVIDDFERALQNVRASDDVNAIAEGVELIYTKFMAYLSQQGVKPIEATGQPFDTEVYDAIATIPAPEEGLKGKVVDCVQTGYTLFDKVIRHAKVVVGE